MYFIIELFTTILNKKPSGRMVTIERNRPDKFMPNFVLIIINTVVILFVFVECFGSFCSIRPKVKVSYHFCFMVI